jgi:hypothetical protein
MKFSKLTAIIILVVVVSLATPFILMEFTDLRGLGLSVAVTVIILTVTGAALVAYSSSNKMKAEYDGVSLRVSGPMLNITVPFADITSVDLRNDIKFGVRTWGYAGVRYAGGRFANKEFGDYKMATDMKNKSNIVIHHTRGILVFNLGSAEDTLLTYNTIKSRAR